MFRQRNAEPRDGLTERGEHRLQGFEIRQRERRDVGADVQRRRVPIDVLRHGERDGGVGRQRPVRGDPEFAHALEILEDRAPEAAMHEPHPGPVAPAHLARAGASQGGVDP